MNWEQPTLSMPRNCHIVFNVNLDPHARLRDWPFRICGQDHGSSHCAELGKRVNRAFQLWHLLECGFHHETILSGDPVGFKDLWDSFKGFKALMDICMGSLQANERADLPAYTSGIDPGSVAFDHPGVLQPLDS